MEVGGGIAGIADKRTERVGSDYCTRPSGGCGLSDKKKMFLPVII